MADQGPKIPQGLVLFVLGNAQSTTASSYRGRRPPVYPNNLNEKHGALVTLPSSYNEALELALRFFGSQLSITSTEDIVLKRAISSPHTFNSVVYAEFDPDDWDKVTVGAEIEIGVFKSTKVDSDSAPTRLQDPLYPDYSPPPSPVPFPAPFAAPINNPWLNKSFAYTPMAYNPAPSDNKDKTVQLTRIISANAESLANGEGVETALINVPDTYEDCERVAREVFNAPPGSKITMKVASMPSGIYSYADYGKANKWTVVHKTAYTTSILTYNGAFEILVGFAGDDERVKSPESAAGEGSSDTFLML